MAELDTCVRCGWRGPHVICFDASRKIPGEAILPKQKVRRPGSAREFHGFESTEDQRERAGQAQQKRWGLYYDNRIN